MSRLRRLGRLAIVDITPLREVAGFRALFSAMFFAQAGRQLTIIAVAIQIFDLTGSTLAVGLIGLAQLVPLLTVSLIGGALADAFDRRRLLIVADLILAVTGLGLYLNSTLAAPLVWPLYALIAINAGVAGMYNPARQAMLPGLVGRALFPRALALNQSQVQLAKTAVPAVGGYLIAVAGIPAAFAIQTVLYLVGALLLLRVPRVEVEGGRRSFSVASIGEGLRFLKSRRLIQAAYLIDFSAMVFGMPTAVFPAFGTEVLGGDEFTVGLLYAAPGAGAAIAALTSGWVGRVRRQGKAVVAAVLAWGLGIAVFGFTRSIVLSFAVLAFAGAADVVSAIFRQSMTQLNIPDSLRGRLTSVHTVASGGGPRLGEFEAGAMAELTSVRFSVISGGLACAVSAVAIARWAPQFYNYEYDPDDEIPPDPT